MKTLHRYIVVLLFHFPFYYYLYDTYKSIVRDFQEKYSEETFQYSLELCKCNRTLQKTILLSNDSISFQNTTCGRDAFMRGSHQRVAAFSFYGGGFDPKLTKIFFEGKLIHYTIIQSIHLQVMKESEAIWLVWRNTTTPAGAWDSILIWTRKIHSWRISAVLPATSPPWTYVMSSNLLSSL